MAVSNSIRGTAYVLSRIGRRGFLDLYADVAPPSGDVCVFKAPPHVRFRVTRGAAIQGYIAVCYHLNFFVHGVKYWGICVTGLKRMRINETQIECDSG